MLSPASAVRLLFVVIYHRYTDEGYTVYIRICLFVCVYLVVRLRNTSLCNCLSESLSVCVWERWATWLSFERSKCWLLVKDLIQSIHRNWPESKLYSGVNLIWKLRVVSPGFKTGGSRLLKVQQRVVRSDPQTPSRIDGYGAIHTVTIDNLHG